MESSVPCDVCGRCTSVLSLWLPFSRLVRLHPTNNRRAGFRKLNSCCQYGIARWHASFNGTTQHSRGWYAKSDIRQANMKPPYPPMVWALGGPPVKKVDIPAQTIFMILFMIGAAVHMKIFQKNRKRGHKFLFNLFIFSMPSLRLDPIATANLNFSLLRVTSSYIDTSNCLNSTFSECQTCYCGIHLRCSGCPDPFHHQPCFRHAARSIVTPSIGMAPCV